MYYQVGDTVSTVFDFRSTFHIQQIVSYASYEEGAVKTKEIYRLYDPWTNAMSEMEDRFLLPTGLSLDDILDGYNQCLDLAAILQDPSYEEIAQHLMASLHVKRNFEFLIYSF